MAAQLERAQLETGAGAQRRIEEHQGDRLRPLQLVAELAALEGDRLREQRVELRAAPVLGIEEVLHGGQRSCWLAWRKQKSPARGWAFPVTNRRRPAYPAEMCGSGRRAREVMPAAMRAEVRMSALAWRVASCWAEYVSSAGAAATQRYADRALLRHDRDPDPQAIAGVAVQARHVLLALVLVSTSKPVRRRSSRSTAPCGSAVAARCFGVLRLRRGRRGRSAAAAGTASSRVRRSGRPA